MQQEWERNGKGKSHVVGDDRSGVGRDVPLGGIGVEREEQSQRLFFRREEGKGRLQRVGEW